VINFEIVGASASLGRADAYVTPATTPNSRNAGLSRRSSARVVRRKASKAKLASEDPEPVKDFNERFEDLRKRDAEVSPHTTARMQQEASPGN
jgi:hypothetical protein